ncbi:MAG: hypothetical protein HQM00_08255 [Magnetococcales bacterium]|nr:hypothetical protein [Magnetococcales bacterium]
MCFYDKLDCLKESYVKIRSGMFTEHYTVTFGFLLSVLVVFAGSIGINYLRSYSDAIGLPFLDMVIPLEVHYYNSFLSLSRLSLFELGTVITLIVIFSFSCLFIDSGMRCQKEYGKEGDVGVLIFLMSSVMVTLLIYMVNRALDATDSLARRNCFVYLSCPEDYFGPQVDVVLDSKKESYQVRGFLLFANSGSTYIMKSHVTDQDKVDYADKPEKFCGEQKSNAKWEIIRLNNTKIIKIEPAREKDSSASQKRTCRAQL